MNVSCVHICHLGVSHLHSQENEVFHWLFQQEWQCCSWHRCSSVQELRCSPTTDSSYVQPGSADPVSCSFQQRGRHLRKQQEGAEEEEFWRGRTSPSVGLQAWGLEVCAQQLLLWSSISTPGVFRCLNNTVWSWAGSTLGHFRVEHTSLTHRYIKHMTF